MECNKEDAIRAKEVAVKKMEDKDFVAARKFASRAQQLNVDIKDIPQMIIVCDVHCAAQNKIFGGENDWYRILQLEQTVDEITIKKQYRKLALLLHPDKNQFAGAADAFKLIGEAQKVLLDNQMRMVYDNRYRASRKVQVSNFATQRNARQPANWPQSVFQSVNLGNAPPKSMNQQAQQQQKVQTQPTLNTDRATFWTGCPFCLVKYEYYRELVNKPLICPGCKKRFTGFEANGPTNYSGTSSQASQKKEHSVMKKGQSSTVPQYTFTKRSSKPTKAGTKIFGNAKYETMFTSRVNKKPDLHDKVRNNNVKASNNKKKKKENNSSGSSSDDSESSSDSEEEESEEDDNSVEELVEELNDDDDDDDDQVDQESGHQSEQNLRRSLRSKQQVSYDDYPSDDESGKPSKKTKFTEDADDVENLANDGVGPTTSLGGDCVVRDPDFNDFDPQRSMDKFKVGQVWALYSDEDALPKYYGVITKINHSPSNFELHMSWLNRLKSEPMIPWADKRIPVSCGKFQVKRKISQKYDNPGPFSHELRAQPSKEKDVYNILPQKGDIWALYKNWNVNMSYSDLKVCEYEIVEVLEIVNNSSIIVLILEHVKKYTSVYKPKKRGEFELLTMQIPWTEMLRFSHQIPAIRLSEENEGTLKGFWELDTAALPFYHFL